jgi:uncharacterized membrane protein YgaE (UPF0421/DUF939 family)
MNDAAMAKWPRVSDLADELESTLHQLLDHCLDMVELADTARHEAEDELLEMTDKYEELVKGIKHE